MTQMDLNLRGLEAPVRLSGPGWCAADFAGFLPNWPFTITDPSRKQPFAEIERTAETFVFRSDFGDGPVSHKSLVNAVCDLIAHAARQRTRERPDDLCLHASAVQIGGGLAVMPALRRAGKSTMTAALAAKGHSVFSDDVLPISAAPGAPLLGRAMGAAIRLRLPLPDTLPVWLRNEVATVGGPQNRQYQYLPWPQVAAHDTAAPLLALISLEYVAGAPATMTSLSRGKMLKSLLKQNFAREADGDHILAALFTIAQELPSFHLRYSDLDEAITMLCDRLATLAPKPLQMPQLPNAEPIDLLQVDTPPDCPLIRRTGATLIDMDGEAFGVSADQRNIIHFDAGSLRLWSLFDQPTSEQEAAEILAAAFPDVSKSQIEAEATPVIQRLVRAGLLVPA